MFNFVYVEMTKSAFKKFKKQLLKTSSFRVFCRLILCQNNKNSIRDACTAQGNVFDTMRYRGSETVQRSGDFHSKQCQLYEGRNNVSRENNVYERENASKL